jgi:LysM repeat protein
MKNPSPLVPQGSLLEQKNQSRARVKIAVFLVLTIHGIGLLALLMQGCKKEDNLGAGSEATNNPAIAFADPTNTPSLATNEPALANNLTSPPPAIETNTPPIPPVSGLTEYTLASGDNFSSLSKKFHVTLKALMDANPGLEPTKLKVGQKINIPPPTTATTPTTSPSGSGATASATSEQVYSVKSGDSLTKIATHFGTTVKAIRSLNGLKTDKIVVGQKLKIPAKGSTPVEPAPAPAGSSSGQ